MTTQDGGRESGPATDQVIRVMARPWDYMSSADEPDVVIAWPDRRGHWDRLGSGTWHPGTPNPDCCAVIVR